MIGPMKLRAVVCWLSLFAAAHAAPPDSPAALPQKVPDTPESAKLSTEAKSAAEAGLVAFAKGDLEVARTKFQKLVQLSPGNLTGLVNLGSVEYRLKHMEAAEKLLARAVRIDPDAGLAWLTLGVIYNDENKLDEALAALSRAVLLDPKNARAHNALADTLWRKGWTGGTEDELQKTVELDPDFADAHYNLALAYLRRTPPAIELARRHYERARELGAARDAAVEKQLSDAPAP